jgi:hypothetical protein
MNMYVLQREDGLIYAGLDRNAWTYSPAWTDPAKGGKIEIQHKDRWPLILRDIETYFDVDPEELEGELVKLTDLP